ncbi:MAG: hypothetical protein C4297_08215 [Gemmataceae bacterium]
MSDTEWAAPRQRVSLVASLDTFLVRVAIPVLLTVTAGLKIWLLVQNRAAGSLLVSGSPRREALALVVELIVAWWFASGVGIELARLFGLVLFATFAGISLYWARLGLPTCGCFGQLTVSPWYTFGLDVALVVLLTLGLLARKKADRSAGLSSGLEAGRTLSQVALLLVGLALAAGTVWWQWDELVAPGDFLAELRGEPVSIVPPLLDAGHAPVGDTRHLTVALRNHTRSVAVVQGYQSSSFARVRIPVGTHIPPRGQVDMPIECIFCFTEGTAAGIYLLHVEVNGKLVTIQGAARGFVVKKEGKL